MSYASSEPFENLKKVDGVDQPCSFDDSCTDTGSGSSSSDEDCFDSSTNSQTIATAFASTSNLQQCSSHETNKVVGDGLMMSLEMVKMLRKSASEGNLHLLSPQSLVKSIKPSVSQQLSVACKLPPRSKSVTAKYSSIANAVQERKRMFKVTNHNVIEVRSPKEMIKDVLRIQQGIELKCYKYNDTVLDNYFVKGVTNCRSADATQLLNRAIRDNDLKTIQELHQVMDCNLQCCNKFQESIVHTVARRGYIEILQYLYLVADVSLRVCCDGGRNALHDACWTSQPNFHLIQLFVQDSPDLLYIMDKRSNTPLDYIPKEAYGVWNKWLQTNAHLLKPTVLPYMVAIK